MHKETFNTQLPVRRREIILGLCDSLELLITRTIKEIDWRGAEME